MRGHQPIKYTHTQSMTAILLRASRPEESGLRNSNPHCCVTNNLSQRVSGLLKWRARKSAQSRRNVILVIRCQNTPSKFQDGRRERERSQVQISIMRIGFRHLRLFAASGTTRRRRRRRLDWSFVPPLHGSSVVLRGARLCRLRFRVTFRRRGKKPIHAQCVDNSIPANLL